MQLLPEDGAVNIDAAALCKGCIHSRWALKLDTALPQLRVAVCSSTSPQQHPSRTLRPAQAPPAAAPPAPRRPRGSQEGSARGSPARWELPLPRGRSLALPRRVRLSAARERSLIRDRRNQSRRCERQSEPEPIPTRGVRLRPGICFQARPPRGARAPVTLIPRFSGARRRGRERSGAGLGGAAAPHAQEARCLPAYEEPAASHAARRSHGIVSGRRGCGCCPRGGEGAGGAAGPGGRYGHGAALPAAGGRRGGGGRWRAPRLRLLPGLALAALLQSTRWGGWGWLAGGAGGQRPVGGATLPAGRRKRKRPRGLRGWVARGGGARGEPGRPLRAPHTCTWGTPLRESVSGPGLHLLCPPRAHPHPPLLSSRRGLVWPKAGPWERVAVASWCRCCLFFKLRLHSPA